MNSACCNAKCPELEKIARDQKRILWAVLIINLVMFVVEFGSGIYAGSLALLGDSLDMLGDGLAYGVSLYVVGKGMIAKARSAMFKGGIILLSSLSVLAASVYRSFFQEVPAFEVMGGVGLLALSANLLCLVLLTKHRNTDVNMASVWLCSRNDIIANVSVLGAAELVRQTSSHWPDVIVGGGLAVLFFRSAIHIFAESQRALSETTA